MRYGEIANLKWNNVDLQARRIKVEHSKSGKPRFININAPLFETLLTLKQTSSRNPYVFPNSDTRKPYNTLRHSFVSPCKKAGIYGFRFHDLRHTFASRLIAAGVDIETVKSLLGHHSIVVTQRYTHSNEEIRKRAVELLAEIVPQRPQKEGNLLHHSDMGKIVKFIEFSKEAISN